MDLLQDILAVARFGDAELGYAELVRPWGLEMDPMAEVAVHSLRRGSAWLRLAQLEPIALAEGDVVLIRAGVAHSISDSLDSPILPHQSALEEMPARLRSLPPEQAGATHIALCAKYLFHELTPHPLISRLPRLIHVSTTQPRHAQLGRVLDLLAHEAVEGGGGSELVVPRLVDSLLVFVLRAFLEEQPTGAEGWFAALKDPAIHKALALIHEQPAKAWTVEGLAREVAQSRPTFARRFSELVGETPVAYLTRWRMALASKLLRESQLSVDEISQRVGYESGAAFSKAFSRSLGVAPGRYRTHARQSAA